MTRYHITDNGPAPCSATVSACPYAAVAPHFDDSAAAEAYFANSQGGAAPAALKRARKRTYAPVKPALELPTVEEVKEILSRNTSDAYPVTKGELIGFTLTGSAMYGLEHPDSDRDITAITTEKRGGDFHHVYPDGKDIRVTSLDRIITRAMNGKTGEVDVLASPLLTLTNPEYRPFINALRIDTLKYRDAMESHMRRDVENALRDTVALKRGAKSLKTALRNAFISERVAKHDLDYTVAFDEVAREFFYERLHFLNESPLLGGFEESQDTEEMRTERVDAILTHMYEIAKNERNTESGKRN